jgi:hypothetical protein
MPTGLDNIACTLRVLDDLEALSFMPFESATTLFSCSQT